MTKLIFAILFTSLSLFSCGQAKPDKDKERINAACDRFMQNFRDGKISDAMQVLKENSVLAPATIDTLRETINYQIENIIPGYGKILSYEFVMEKKVKNFIAQRFYVLKLEKYYLKFSFALYNNGTVWTITNFRYNEDISEVL